jgi:hypothetical protein
VLYFYGNAQCIAYSAETVDFGRMGLNVLVPDYVGYGMSAGQASDDGVYRTAEAAYAYLVQQRHIAPCRIVVAGRSMGGAAAVYLASRHPVGGLATFSTFTTLGEAAHRVVPWLPAETMLGHRMDNLARMAKVACPVWVAYGGADVVVPPAMSERLASAAPPASHAQRVCILRADHNNLFQVGGPDLLSRFAQFVQQSTAPRAGAPNRN